MQENGRRGFLRFLAGLGLGATGIELYERLYHTLTLEESFRDEVKYWMGKYNEADEEIRKLESEKESLTQNIKLGR